MKGKDLVAKLKAHRGDVLVAVLNSNDSYYVRAVKSDLIDVMSTKFGPEDETGFELDDEGYFDKDYGA